jgi:hypothetical protein
LFCHSSTTISFSQDPAYFHWFFQGSLISLRTCQWVHALLYIFPRSMETLRRRFARMSRPGPGRREMSPDPTAGGRQITHRSICFLPISGPNKYRSRRCSRFIIPGEMKRIVMPYQQLIPAQRRSSFFEPLDLIDTNRGGLHARERTCPLPVEASFERN